MTKGICSIYLRLLFLKFHACTVYFFKSNILHHIFLLSFTDMFYKYLRAYWHINWINCHYIYWSIPMWRILLFTLYMNLNDTDNLSFKESLHTVFSGNTFPSTMPMPQSIQSLIISTYWCSTSTKRMKSIFRRNITQ